MGYIVSVERGKGNDKIILRSIKLSNKKAVCRWIKKNPAIRINTDISVLNVKTKKKIIGKPAKFCLKDSKF